MAIEESVRGDAEIFNLIETQDFPEMSGSQSVTFSDLNGEDTPQYKIKFHFYVHAGGDNRNIAIRFNNDSGANYYGGENYYGSSSSSNAFSGTGGRIARSINSVNSRTRNGEVYISPNILSDGSYRGFKSDFLVENGTSYQYRFGMFGYWTNVVDEITSIKVYTTGGSGSGYYMEDSWVELYKQSPLI